jgi:hypothetical protein
VPDIPDFYIPEYRLEDIIWTVALYTEIWCA